MILSILQEPPYETRVAIVPKDISALMQLKCSEIWVQQAAGNRAHFNDADYQIQHAGIKSSKEIISASDVILCINPLEKEHDAGIKAGQIVIGQFDPLHNHEFILRMAEKKVSCFSMDLMPRITRAQSMDVLSSMATVAGYKAVLLAAMHLPNFFPMFMTAAGTVKPAKVLVLGAGVAGLQALSTARRLGAMVEAFDVRAAAREDVLSVGAKFIEVEGASDDVSKGGYAVEQTEAYQKKQTLLIHEHAIKSDVIICTAQIPGRKAPVLIQKNTIEQMRPGAVVVDLAASTGGNCALTENDQTLVWNGVTIIGNSNLASGMPTDASQMYSKNILNFLKLLIEDGKVKLNFDDEIIAGTCVVHEGNIVHKRVRDSMQVVKM